MYVAGSPLTRIDCSRIKDDKDHGAGQVACQPLPHLTSSI